MNKFIWNSKIIGYLITIEWFFYQFFNNFSEILLCNFFLHLYYGWFFSDFCCIAKYWISDRMQLLDETVRTMHRLMQMRHENITNIVRVEMKWRRRNLDKRKTRYGALEIWSSSCKWQRQNWESFSIKARREKCYRPP